MFDLATSVLAYLVLTVAMFFALQVSYLLVLVLAIPAAGFLIRTFIVFHDCAHGSFTALQAGERDAGRGARSGALHTVRVVAAQARRAPCDHRRPRSAEEWGTSRP